MPERVSARALFWVASAAGLAADQLTKWLIYERMLGSRDVTVVPGFFHLRGAQNQGVVWGLFSSRPGLVAAAGVVSAVLVVVFYFRFAGDSKVEGLAWGLVLGGAAGNLIDRIAFNHVRDFLDFKLAGYSWPTFNIADCCITLGAIYLVIHYFFVETPPEPAEKV